MRINLFGGPGSGKSTTAAWLFSELKYAQTSVELVTEYVKVWATQQRKINDFDQVYLFGKQIQYEYRFLSNGIKNIVTDSPVLLSSMYANVYCKHLNFAADMEHIADVYEKQFPSINIFLVRGDKPYVTQGRYQTHEQAKEIDALVLETLKRKEKEGLKLVQFSYKDKEAILAYVLSNVAK